MPEMPERVYLSGFDSYQGWSLDPCDDCTAYISETLATQRERAAFEAGVELRDNFGRRPTSQEVGAAFAAYLKTREGA